MCDATLPDRTIGAPPLRAGRDVVSGANENDAAHTTRIQAAPLPPEPMSPGTTETIGRYTLSPRIAKGGMGSVHVGLMRGPAGFSRIVAIKRLHRHIAEDSEFVLRFKDEVRLSSRVTHPNVVQALDVVEAEGELLLVMEYVEGETLYALQVGARRANQLVPVDVAVAIAVASLHGLHAAHLAADEYGRPLNIVHRDVSPQNVMIGESGQVKVLDFGVARAARQAHVTFAGEFIGKFGYVAPEQAAGHAIDRRSDVFAAGVVLWETLVGDRLFRGQKRAVAVGDLEIFSHPTPPPSRFRSDVAPDLDAVVLRALQREPQQRYQTALEFALALEAVAKPSSASAIGRIVKQFCAPELDRRAAIVSGLRRGVTGESPPSIDSSIQVETPSRQARHSDSESAIATRPRPSYQAPIGRVVMALVVLVCAMAAFSHRWSQSAALSPLPERVVEPAAPQAAPTTANRPPPYVATQVTPVTTAEAPHATRAALSAPGAYVPRSRRSPASSPAASSPAASSTCNPPTFLGDDGIRHFKPGCL